MGFLSRRLSVSSILLTGLLTAASLAAAVPPASAATFNLSLSQTATTLKAGSVEVATASVTMDGAPAPDGTLVHFSVTGIRGQYTVTDDDLVTGPSVWAMVRHGADGYWMADQEGLVRAFGSAPYLGDLQSAGVDAVLAGMAPTPSGNGYWLATEDGHVYGFGDAAPEVGVVALGDDWVAGIAPSPFGYRRVTGSGRVIPSEFGNTASPAAPLFDDGEAIGIVSTPSGNGYWVYNAAGHIAAFGDALFKGDTHSLPLDHAIVGMASTSSGAGYWLTADDGTIFAFGDAGFYGSTGGKPMQSPVNGVLPTASGQGYWLFTTMGAVFPFGDARNRGSVFDVPTANGRAGFAFSSVAPGTTMVSALGPPSMTGNSTATITQSWTPADGYWMLGSDGAVYPFGGATNLGDAKPYLSGHEAVDLEPAPDLGGYWIVDDAGRVFAFGTADAAIGNADPARLVAGEKVTSLSATPSGHGYWIFTSKGRVLAKGDATSYGDMSAVALNGPVLDSIPTPSGEGYYMVASDGGIFAFGDATFAGSMGGQRLNAPVQSLVPDPDGAGYWLVASDGGIFNFDAEYHGSMGDRKLNKPVTGMVPFGDGYLMVGEDGGIFNFSDRQFYGSLGANPPARPIVSVAVLDPFGG
jgi:hypothetical protein